MPTSILLVDDHRILLDGLRKLLQDQEDLAIVGEATDGREAVLLASRLRPDVVVMDVSMPGLNGIEATRQILAANAATKVVTLSVHSEQRLISDCLRAGAAAYIPKECSFDELATAIRTVAQGKVYLSPSIAHLVMNDLRGAQPDEQSVYSVLSGREREVLQLMAEGKSTKEIALVLGLSVKTIETYRRLLMEKLGLYSIAELTKYAIRQRLTSLDVMPTTN